MSKPAIVFLCQRLPYPPIKGERITSYNLVRFLSRHYRVFVGTFSDDPADLPEIPKLRAMVEDLHVTHIRKPWAYARALPRWIAGEPISYALFRSDALARWIRAVEQAHQPVAVIGHSSNISTYAIDAWGSHSQRLPRRFLHFSDVDSEKFVAYADRASGLRRWIFAIEARRVRREELRLARAADHVAFVSDEEATLFRSEVAPQLGNVVTLPNGVDSETFDPNRYPDCPFEGHGAAMVFTGAMDYPPNIQAVEWFAREVFPKIRATLPNAQFLIVGSNPTPAVRALAGAPGVIVTGRVPSAAAYLAHAQVAVAPLQIARGIQNKVLEAMAMAMPVVVSPGALTGIAATPAVHVIRAETPDEWVRACLTMIQDRDRAKALGAAARRLVTEQYDWEAQFTRLAGWLGTPRQQS